MKILRFKILENIEEFKKKNLQHAEDFIERCSTAVVKLCGQCAFC